MKAAENSPFGPPSIEDEVTIEVHSWDYLMSVVYTIALLINVCGIAKFAYSANLLTILIMLTNFGAIFCKKTTLLDTVSSLVHRFAS